METVINFFAENTDNDAMFESRQIDFSLQNVSHPDPEDEDETEDDDEDEDKSDDSTDHNPPIDPDVHHAPVTTEPGGGPKKK